MEFVGLAILIGIGLIAVLWYRAQDVSFPRISLRKAERISFTSPEKRAGDAAITIVGNYWKGKSDRGVLLLHMMPATKESWDTFAHTLNKRGYHVLAIDLRGHGESTEKILGTKTSHIDYKHFSDTQHQETIYDVAVAHEWLQRQGVKTNKLILGGASIGANLAFQYLVNHPAIPAAFLLSPGVNYNGIHADAAIQNITRSQRVLLIAGDNDLYSSQSVKQLFGMNSKETFLELVITAAHGTDLLTEHPSLTETIINFIQKRDRFDPNLPRDHLYAEYM